MLDRFAAHRQRAAALALAALALAVAGTAVAASGDGPRTTRVSVSSAGAEARAVSSGPSLSGDGRLIAFGSTANDLVPGDHNGKGDIFVRDLKTGSVELVSVNSAGAQGNRPSFVFKPGGQGHPPSLTFAPSISRDGERVAFSSFASNLVPHDSNGAKDVFVRDLKSRRTIRASVSSDGAQANGTSRAAVLSADATTWRSCPVRTT